MKQLIRYETFETNSSSMHSLVISKNARPYDSDDLKLQSFNDKEYELFGCCDRSTFERYPFEVLRTPKDKLRYYVAYYCGTKRDKNKIKEVKNFIHKYTGIPLKKINITAYEYREETIDYSYSYHNKLDKYGQVYSNDTGEDVFHYLESHNISMEEFVLNPKYTVVVDGDEYCNFKQLFEAGIINCDNLQDISTGKDFWSSDILHYHMYYIGSLSKDKNLLDYELNNIKLLLSSKWYKRLEIEDFDIYEEEIITKEMINVLKNILTLCKSLNKVLVLHKNSEDIYSDIVPYFDEVGKSLES